MPSATLKRLTTLESAMLEMTVSVARLSDSGQRTDAALCRLSDEMRAFKDEMRASGQRTEAALARLSDEMRAYKDESARERRELNKQLGEIANNQGRLVEDIVAPSVPRILRSVLGLGPDAPVAPSGPRMRLCHPRHPERMREFDVVAGHDGVVLVAEVKARLAPGDVKRFAEGLAEAREYLAALGARQVLGAVAALHVEASLVKHAERLGLLVLGAGDEMMEVKNGAGFVPKRF